MTTLSLSAVVGLEWQSDVTLSANHFFSLVLSSKVCESGLDLHRSHTGSTESQDQMEGGFLLHVVIGESSFIFEVFSGEDKSLGISWDAFFVLDFSPKHDKLEMGASLT